MPPSKQARRVIQVNKRVMGPREPKERAVRVKHFADYPHVPAAYLDLAKRISSPLLAGPPICDELIEFVRHTFTEEEAGSARWLGAIRGKSAARVAKAEHRPADVIESILERLVSKKRVIAGLGEGTRRRYRLMPVMPGMFEMALIGESPESLTDWHRRFAELVEALFETGYLTDYQEAGAPAIRFMPVAPVLASHPAALPSDRLEVVLDRYDTFGVGHCQCRMSRLVADRGCGRPLEVCTVMGQWAERGIHDGWLRRVSQANVLEIKREAESHGLVTWIMNVESSQGQASCSCCGCCCKAMRAVNEFSSPGIMAPPHFMPKFDVDRCSRCGHCAQDCPMGAITVDISKQILQSPAPSTQISPHPSDRGGGEQGALPLVNHEPARCIGCGLCALACNKQQAITMQPVPDYRLPYKSWLAMLLHRVPSLMKTYWKVQQGR
ncbi:MAG: ATP-binding protein [Planctomycetota bacterium]